MGLFFEIKDENPYRIFLLVYHNFPGIRIESNFTRQDFPPFLFYFITENFCN